MQRDEARTRPTPILDASRAAEASPAADVPNSVARDELPPRSETPNNLARAGGRSRRRTGFAFLALAVLALAAWGGWWGHQRLQFVHEIDARVVADVVTVGSRVEGWVNELSVQSGDVVEAGALVVAIDVRAAELGLTEYRADIAAIEAERDRVTSRRALIDAQTKTREVSERAQLAAARASVDALAHELKFAQAEFERAQKLSKTGVVSTTSLDRARTEFLSARQGLAKARAEVATAKANLDHETSGRKELEVLDNETRMLEQKAAQIGARMQRQALVVEDHKLRSPIPGVVSKTFVLPGEYVRLGQRIALIHDPAKIWVEANIRETEVRRLQVGQPVDMVVDAYPDTPIQGQVERIGHATTGEFALLPSPNPSGNFTKVTQRIPVRIAVTEKAELLKPGMLVEVDIHVRADE